MHHNTEAESRPWGADRHREVKTDSEEVRHGEVNTDHQPADRQVDQPRAHRQTDRQQHGSDPVAGSPGRHPLVLLLHPVPLQSSGHAGSPDLRRELEVPHLHRPGSPGCVLRAVRPHRRVQSADQRRRQQGAGAAAQETDQPQGLDDGRAGLPHRSVRGVHILESLPVRQRAGLPQTAGQLHPPVAQPRHAHHRSSLHHHRDADDSAPLPQPDVGSGSRVLLRRRIHPLDVLGAPGDRGLGVPGVGADRSAGPSRLLQRHDGGAVCVLHSGRNPQHLHLGPTAHRKSQR